MSRRSRLTVEVLVRLPLPAGMSAREGCDMVNMALRDHIENCRTNNVKGAGVSYEALTFRVTKRETTYLT